MRRFVATEVHTYEFEVPDIYDEEEIRAAAARAKVDGPDSSSTELEEVT